MLSFLADVQSACNCTAILALASSAPNWDISNNSQRSTGSFLHLEPRATTHYTPSHQRCLHFQLYIAPLGSQGHGLVCPLFVLVAGGSRTEGEGDSAPDCALSIVVSWSRAGAGSKLPSTEVATAASIRPIASSSDTARITAWVASSCATWGRRQCNAAFVSANVCKVWKWSGYGYRPEHACWLADRTHKAGYVHACRSSSPRTLQRPLETVATRLGGQMVGSRPGPGREHATQKGQALMWVWPGSPARKRTRLAQGICATAVSCVRITMCIHTFPTWPNTKQHQCSRHGTLSETGPLVLQGCATAHLKAQRGDRVRLRGTGA